MVLDLFQPVFKAGFTQIVLEFHLLIHGQCRKFLPGVVLGLLGTWLFPGIWFLWILRLGQPSLKVFRSKMNTEGQLLGILQRLILLQRIFFRLFRLGFFPGNLRNFSEPYHHGFLTKMILEHRLLNFRQRFVIFPSVVHRLFGSRFLPGVGIWIKNLFPPGYKAFST